MANNRQISILMYFLRLAEKASYNATTYARLEREQAEAFSLYADYQADLYGNTDTSSIEVSYAVWAAWCAVRHIDMGATVYKDGALYNAIELWAMYMEG